MVYITGDIHGTQNFRKLSEENFPEQKTMTEKDFLIVCGDLCAFWDNSESEMQLRAQFNKFKFTTLFIDGNHENFDILEQTPVSVWNGGNVHFMGNHLIHLMRGQVFELNGASFFTMGGGYSGDHYHRMEHQNWWRNEIPTCEEFSRGLDNLKHCNWRTDFVLTHTASSQMIQKANLSYEQTMLNVYFDYLENHLDFRQWYFGHFHADKMIDEKHILIYDRVARLL